MNENFRILKPFLRGFPLIVFSMVLAVIIAKKYLSYVTPMYESTLKLKLADINEGVPSSNLFKDFDVFTSSNKIAAEIEVLKSAMLLNKTLDSLDFHLEIYRVGKIRKVELYHESPLIIHNTFNDNQALDRKYALLVGPDNSFTITIPHTGETVTGKFGSKVDFKYGSFLIDVNKNLLTEKPDTDLVGEYEFEFLSKDKLAKKVGHNLDVVAIEKDVAVIRLSYKDAIPEKAAKLINALAHTYINDYIDTKYGAAKVTVDFLDNQISKVATDLAASEAAIEDYRNNKNIINIRQETETDLRKIAQLKIQLSNLEMNLGAVERLNDYIKQGKDDFLKLAPNFEAFTDLLSTEIVKNIKQLQAEKKDLLLVYTEEEERVKVIDKKINDYKEYLIESISNTRNHLKSKYTSLQNEIAAAQSAFKGLPNKERAMLIMNREFEIYQESYNFLNKKKIEAEIAQSAKIAFHRILAAATPSKAPVSPNYSVIVIVSAILGMFGAIALIYVVHLTKAKVNDVYTIEKNSALPIALKTPKLNNQQETKTYFLKEAIELELKGILKNKLVLTITANRLGEGSAFHTKHLACALATQGRKVAIADVAGTLNAEQIDQTNATYINIKTEGFDKSSKANLEAYLSELTRDFDVVIVNNEPLENQTQGLLFMSATDVNLVVLDSRKTPAKKVINTDILKEEYNLPDTWFVLNRAGYNPNVIRELFIIAKNTVKAFQKRKLQTA